MEIDLGSPVFSEASTSLRRYDRISVVTLIAGLLTVPEFHRFTLRLEILAHLATRDCSGKKKPSLCVVEHWLNRLLPKTGGTVLEDPPRDVFVGNVMSPFGNHLILQGLWSENDLWLQDLVDALLGCGNSCSSVLESVLSLLRLSSEMLHWQRTWAPGTVNPHNPVSGTRYSGSNAIWLEMQGRSDPRWMTCKQAQSVGARVRGEEQGTRIQYWKLTDQVPLKDGNGRPMLDADGNKVYRTVQLDIPKVFSAVVFYAEQIEGLPPLEVKAPDWDRHERAESMLKVSGADIRHDQADRAFYRPATDRIHLPARDSFKSADTFYATALYELGHWSGHPSRLDRDLAHPFDSIGYANEELRAEIASLMIGDQLGIGHDPGQHAAYVKSWIQVLKDDPKEILRASRDADKITAYVLDLEKERMPANVERLPRVDRSKTVEPARNDRAPKRVGAGGGRER
jgi:antirestriction protein ArdC